MRYRILTIPALLALLCGTAVAESLWSPEPAPARPVSMFSDMKARRAGDLITILVVESASATQQAATNVQKKESNSAGPGVGPILKAIPGLAFSGSSASQAQGATSRTSTLAARLTVTVKEVRPNGDLVVEGTREVVANNDKQTLKISGVVRQADVAPDNTVLSTYVADAVIELTGKGPIAERQKPGIITRVFRFLF
jgi:flagellar L-ring protein precursor FlgH